MPQVRLPIPALFGGASRQADTVRHANQVQEATNVLLTVRDGASKRPGSTMSFAVGGTIEADESYRIHAIDRDDTEQYLLVLGAMDDGASGTEMSIRIFMLDGTEATVNISADAQTYLDAESATVSDFRLVTVADHTVILNRKVAVAAETSDVYAVESTSRTYEIMRGYQPTNDTYHMTHEDDGFYPAGYFKYIGGADGTFASCARSAVSYTVAYFTDAAKQPQGFLLNLVRFACDINGGGEYTIADDVLDFSPATPFADYTWEDGDKVYINNNFGAIGWYDVVSKDSDSAITLQAGASGADRHNVYIDGIGPEYNVSVDFTGDSPADQYDIATAYTRALHEAGCVDGLINWTMTATDTGYMTIVGPYRGAGTEVRDPDNPTGGEYDMTLSGRPFVSPGNTDGTGTPATETLAIAERWERAPAPRQIEAQLDASTMPIKAVRTSYTPGSPPTIVFDVGLIDWTPRYTGDNYTNPILSLWENGATLADVAFHRNRMVLAGDENLVLSQAGDYFNFYAAEADNIADSDPIDTTLSASQVTFVDYILPFRKALLIFTQAGRQFELNAPETLTPETAAITPSTAYDSLTGVRPVVVGSQCYFVSAQQGTTQLMEYFYSDQNVSNTAADVSAHAGGYLPSDVQTIQASLNNDTVLLLPPDGSTVYVYRNFWNGEDRVQSAWAKWTYDATETICDIAIIEDTCWMLVENADGFFVSSIPVIEDAIDTDASGDDYTYKVRLDNRVAVTGANAAGYTTWTLSVEDSTLGTVVLGPDFTAHDPTATQAEYAGQVLAVTKVDSTHYRIADADGDYADKEAMIGRTFTSELQLSRPYARQRDGSTVLGGRLQLRKLSVQHSNTGRYDIRITEPNRGTLHGTGLPRDKTFTPRSGDLIEDEGVFACIIGAWAEHATITIRSDQPLPFVISTAEFIGTVESRSF